MMFPAALTGSLYNMMKTQQLQMKWQKRQNDPTMAKGDKESPQIKHLRASVENVRKSNIVSSLDGKLKAGMRLSSEEMDYLKLNSPQLYQQALEVERERESYKQALANCETKEEVQRLNTQRTQQFLSEATAVSSNPNISLARKAALMDQVTRKVMGIQSEHIAFTQKPEYASLPTEAELAEEEKRKKKDEAIKVEDKELPELPKEPEQPQLGGNEATEEATGEAPPPAAPGEGVKPPAGGDKPVVGNGTPAGGDKPPVESGKPTAPIGNASASRPTPAAPVGNAPAPRAASAPKPAGSANPRLSIRA